MTIDMPAVVIVKIFRWPMDFPLVVILTLFGSDFVVNNELEFFQIRICLLGSF